MKLKPGARALNAGKNPSEKKCADCPTIVYGNRVRCPACADQHYEKLRAERRKKRWNEKRE